VSVAVKPEALTTQDIEELLDAVDQTMERLKTLYEQYFMGIQKQAPGFLHTDVERKLRDLVQMNIRKTSLRFRLATMQQKFGSYNAYWRRTLRQIENGTYAKNLAKIGREAVRTGSEIPEEILAAMPKRMREQVVRDREAALAIAKRRRLVEEGVPEDGELDAGGQLDAVPPDADDVAAMISEPSVLKREMKTQSGAHLLSEDDDLDFEQLFAAFQDDAEPAKPATQQIAKTQIMPTAAATKTQQITTAIPRVAVPERAGPSDTMLDGLMGGSDDQVAPTQKMPMFEQAAATPRGTSQIPRPPQTGPAPSITPIAPTQKVPNVTFGPGAPRTPAAPSGAASNPTPPPGASTAIPIPKIPPSQQSRPNPIAPGSAAAAGAVPVESMAGPFPRPDHSGAADGKPSIPAPRPTPVPGIPAPRPTPAAGMPAPRQTPVAGMPAPRPPPAAGVTPPRQTPAAGMQAPRPTPPPGTPSPRPAAPLRPPPGMTDADVNALHAKYVQAKQMVGEKVDASSRERLLRTINQTAPKVMEQYKASGVDFTVVVKDNQVVIKAKPKT
jgi:hypothetical protein